MTVAARFPASTFHGYDIAEDALWWVGGWVCWWVVDQCTRVGTGNAGQHPPTHPPDRCRAAKEEAARRGLPNCTFLNSGLDEETMPGVGAYRVRGRDGARK